MEKEKRYRCFHLVLYNEDVTHETAMNFIRENYSYAEILHDNDYDENGEIKKEHCHFIIYFDDARTISAVSKELDIKSNYIIPTEKKKGLLYLIHKNNPEKYQYDINCVTGNLKDTLFSYVSNSLIAEKTSVKLILDYIYTHQFISYYEFLSWVNDNDLWSFFRRSQSTFLKMLDNHNKKYYSDNERSVNDVKS